ncbi:Nuclear import receptor [Lobulomyces angularis]|nr:Nuclear import receptor [Lobulomyces angularis]
MDNLLSALQVLNAPNVERKQRKEAEKWLDNFQKTDEAWTVSEKILRENSATDAKFFAAQTLRQKVLYDFKRLDSAHHSSLRDSIISLLILHKSGSQNLIRQLLLSLCDLSVQLLDWENPVQDILKILTDNDSFGLYLDFLNHLAEEFSLDGKFEMEREVFMERGDKVLKANSYLVISKLIEFLQQNSQKASVMHQKICVCLKSWIKTGDIKVDLIISTPLMQFTFQSLQSEILFEDACDTIAEIIARSRQYKTEKPYIINELLTSISPLLKFLQDPTFLEDEEKCRGLCLIFVEAGEAYFDLILKNFVSFKGIVDALLLCASHESFDIMRITFGFWNIIADELLQPVNIPFKQQWIETYTQLIDIIIKHFHYPEDVTSMTALEKDNFRDDRHYVGDILKLAVSVVGQAEALARPYNIINSFVLEGTCTFKPGTRWQDIEASLFAFRALGGKVSEDESVVVPRILSLIPQLPAHPKLQYAAVLVIGRYSHWTAKHPEYIPYQLQFISKGFEEKEAVGASALAMKFLCESCGHLMIDYLTQLHPFYNQVISNLSKVDRIEMTEAIANVISAVPLENMLSTVQSFTLPIAQRLHDIANRTVANGDGLESIVSEAKELLDNLSLFVKIISPKIPKNHSHPMVELMQGFWPIFTKLLDNYGSTPIAVGVSRILRYSMENYRDHMLPLLPLIIQKMMEGYESTASSTYLWIANKCVLVYASESSTTGVELGNVIVKLTTITVSLFRNCSRLDDIPDVVEDYFIVVESYAEQCPNLFCKLPVLGQIIQTALGCLSVENLASLKAVLEFIDNFLSMIAPRKKPSIASKDSQYFTKSTILPEYGYAILKTILDGMLFTFPWESDIIHEVGRVLFLTINALQPDGFELFCKCVFDVDDNLVKLEEKNKFLEKYKTNFDLNEEGKCRKNLNDFSLSFRRKNLISGRQ